MNERPTPETDAARHDLSDYGSPVPCSYGDWVPFEVAEKLERERDEARDILRKLLEIIPEPECHDFGHTKEEQHAFLEKCPVMERYDALIAQAKDVAK